jgi:small-conductance mechanosensitive channel
MSLGLLLLTVSLQVPAPPRADTTAALRVGNRPVMLFRTPVASLSPGARAAGARLRIDALLRSGADSVSTRTISEGVLVLLNGQLAFMVAPGDADTIAGETPEQRARVAAAQLQLAVGEVLEARSVRTLLGALARALLASIVFALAIQLLVRLRRRAAARVARLAAAVPVIGVRGFTLFSPEQLHRALLVALRAAAWAGGALAAYLYLTYVLTRFPFTRPWGEALGDYLGHTLASMGLGILRAIPGLFTVALIVVATRFAARLLRALFEAVERGAVQLPGIHPELAAPTRRLLVALLWLFAMVTAYPYLPGSGSDVFKGISVFVGVILSLGSTGLMNQAMSGLVLMYARALRAGDYVRIADTEGTVTALGLLSTKIRTLRQEEVTIPNAVVVATGTMNYSRSTGDAGLMVSTTVTIGYDAPWRQVHALLVTAAGRTRGLKRTPPPFVRQPALSDFYVEYEVFAYLERPEERRPVLSELHAHIQDCFNEHEVQIMSPHFESQPEGRVYVPKVKWSPPPVGKGDA